MLMNSNLNNILDEIPNSFPMERDQREILGHLMLRLRRHARKTHNFQWADDLRLLLENFGIDVVAMDNEKLGPNKQDIATKHQSLGTTNQSIKNAETQMAIKAVLDAVEKKPPVKTSGTASGRTFSSCPSFQEIPKK